MTLFCDGVLWQRFLGGKFLEFASRRYTRVPALDVLRDENFLRRSELDITVSRYQSLTVFCNKAAD